MEGVLPFRNNKQNIKCTNLLLDDASCFNQLSFKLKLPVSCLRSHFCTFLSILKLSHSCLVVIRNNYHEVIKISVYGETAIVRW